MNNQSKSVFHLHNSLTVIVALGWFYLYRIYEPDLRQNFNLLGLLDLFRFFRLYASVLSDVFRESNYIPFLRDVFGGLNFIPFCYFLIIPLGLITIRLWSRGLPASNSRFRRIYYVVAKSQEVYGYRSKHDNAESKLRLSLWIDRENKIAYHYKEGH
jgi:hypothetical protein